MIWCCGDKKIEYGSRTLIMGIVNITPDSFSDGGEHFDADNAVAHAIRLVEEGADIIDLGAQSTRPDYVEISAEEEWKRLQGVLQKLKGNINVPISVDTYYPYVAEKALKCGVSIINDVSGRFNRQMAEIVKNSACGWILMHNGSGNAADIKHFFEEICQKCCDYGINKNQLCFDMGIGFGKNYEQNLSLIAKISEYKIKDCPLLFGASRKRVIGQGSRQPIASERIYGNIAADTAAISGGADIIRLHDVKNEIQGIYMADEIKRAGISNG